MKNNRVIVDKRDTGKTTYLFNEVAKLLKDDVGIIVLDSATDHVDKSLQQKILTKYDNVVVIKPVSEEQIVLNQIGINYFMNNYKSFFPYNEIMTNKDKIICIDLSFFLEKAYEVYEETNNKDLYDHYRSLYNWLSQQIVVSLILMEKEKEITNKCVVMDEIEFPITNYKIETLEDDIMFIASVHPENSFGTFYLSFEKIPFEPYVKGMEANNEYIRRRTKKGNKISSRNTTDN